MTVYMSRDGVEGKTCDGDTLPYISVHSVLF